MPPLAFLGLGPWELITIALVMLLLFGPRAARAMGSMGRGILEVKKEVDETKAGFKKAVRNQVEAAFQGPAPKKPKKAKPPEPDEKANEAQPS